VKKASLAFLERLMNTPSPSGFEQPVQRIVRDEAAKLADEVRTDLHGNVIAVKNPSGTPRVMLAGHCDQIGLMIQHITDEGYLKFAQIGGVDPTVLAGQRVIVHSEHGPVPGIIGRKPVHVMKPEERGGKIELTDLYIDLGVCGKKAAAKLVEVGDPVTFELGMQSLAGDLRFAAGFDDKVGVFVAMEVLRLLQKEDVACAIYSVSTVQEEVGLRGAQTSAFGIAPLVGIAIDVTHASDCAGVDPGQCGEIKMGSGPAIGRGPNINPVVGRMLIDTARKEKIPYQVEPCPRSTGTDANAIQVSRAGVAAGLISIPNRYMHTPVEVISLSDLENAARLIAAMLRTIDETTDFTPV